MPGFSPPFINVWAMESLLGALAMEFGLALFIAWLHQRWKHIMPGFQCNFRHTFLLVSVLFILFNFPGFHLLAHYPRFAYLIALGTPTLLILLFSKLFKDFHCRSVFTAIKASFFLYFLVLGPFAMLILSQLATFFIMNRREL